MCEKQGLLAGFAKIDITPDYAVGLAGYSNEEFRRSEGVEDKIYATCIALTDGDETILIYTIDTSDVCRSVADEIRAVVSPAVGVPTEKIFIGSTHTHSAPSLVRHPEVAMYKNQMYAACARGAKLAMEDRAPAKVLAGKKEFPRWNNTRHVRLENGVVAGYN